MFLEGEKRVRDGRCRVCRVSSFLLALLFSPILVLGDVERLVMIRVRWSIRKFFNENSYRNDGQRWTCLFSEGDSGRVWGYRDGVR